MAPSEGHRPETSNRPLIRPRAETARGHLLPRGEKDQETDGLAPSPLEGEARRSRGEPFVEYSFPSLDAVDVLFKNKKRWVAVEVKSRISSEKDYERGLYQCVKYHALLEATKKDDNYKVPEDIQVVLLLEKTLPQRYKQAATELNIKVIENIKAPRKKV